MDTQISFADWDKAGLGSADEWPWQLKSAAQIIIPTRLPMLLAWGSELRMFFNPSFARILGPAWRDALGKSMRVAWAKAWPEFGRLVERALQGETVLVEDMAVHTQRSGFEDVGYFSFTYAPLLDGEEVTGLVCVCVETTRSVGREKELRQMHSEMIHISRTTAMQAMASTLAHEINQPLAALSAYLAGAERLVCGDGPPDVAALREVIREARQSGERAAEIVRRTRELLRSGIPKLNRVEAAPLIKAAVDLAFDKQSRRMVNIQQDVDSTIAIRCDEVQIQQVLINLIRNAIEAMEATEARKLTISAELRGAEAQFFVEDTGSGIPEALRPKLFETFQSAKTGGMGIGLSISRTIVEAHGGRLWLERSSGSGARFCFTVPAEVEGA